MKSNCDSNFRSTRGNKTRGKNNSSSNESTNRSEPARPTPRPLSGKPFFTTILSKSQVHDPHQLAIPGHFCPHLPYKCAPMVLSMGNKEWEVKLRYYDANYPIKKMDSGWKRFVTDNELKIGDGCVFELVDTEPVRLEVRILNGEVPEPFR